MVTLNASNIKMPCPGAYGVHDLRTFLRAAMTQLCKTHSPSVYILFGWDFIAGAGAFGETVPIPAWVIREERLINRRVQLRDAALAIGIGSLKAGALLPTLPEGIQELEAFIQRSGVDGKFRKSDRGTKGYVCEGRFVATEQPLTSVGQMLVDQRSVR